jgi:hypothetical protein
LREHCITETQWVRVHLPPIVVEVIRISEFHRGERINKMGSPRKEWGGRTINTIMRTPIPFLAAPIMSLGAARLDVCLQATPAMRACRTSLTRFEEALHRGNAMSSRTSASDHR